MATSTLAESGTKYPIIVEDYKHLIQKIELDGKPSTDDSVHGYRTGYYTFSYGMKKIVWGQYTQFLTEQQYRNLLGQARAKGWNIFG